MKKIALILVGFLLCIFNLKAQDTVSVVGVIIDEDKTPLEFVEVYIADVDEFVTSDSEGSFSIKLLSNQDYTLEIGGAIVELFEKVINVKTDTTIFIEAKPLVYVVSGTTIYSDSDAFGVRVLKSTEDGGLYEAKKTEVVDIENQISNKAANNARQALGKIPSLNIWESDNAGLQLDIGGRGLSPKRTSNFNTRQNGYDISADALGYPESYYSPPLQAVKQIEFVRGAGALQYGTQFGGLVNFKLKEGNKEKSFNIESHNTYGANRFFSTYNGIHGQVKKLNHYSYFQYKRGDGWRPNSDFEQFGGYVGLGLEASKKLKLDFDFTHMYYLSQQAGGLTDEDFNDDNKISNRERNWFEVSWTLPALSLEYEISKNAKVYSRTFGLIARRTSLGLLNTPDEDDPLSNRDLINGKFRNIGNETRVNLSYQNKKGLKNTLLIGSRVYRGYTRFSQQFGTDGSDADFTEVDTAIDRRNKSFYNFPNFNAAFFAEKIIRVNESLNLVPGFRYEYIKTKSNGYYLNAISRNLQEEVTEVRIDESSQNERHIFLYGLGASYYLFKNYKLYANATANYRAINFTDVQIQTNTQVVDPDIVDESGYTFDVGIRRLSFSPFFIEGGFFFILYDNRIGEVRDDDLRRRTNIGNATIYGVELFSELDILKLIEPDNTSDHKLSVFVNGSWNRGFYTKINDRALVGVRTGNQLEELPDYNIKTGISYGYKKFSASTQATFVGKQYSDAANTEDPFLGVFGPIPAYEVVDFSAKYEISKHFTVGGSVNNVLNEIYFTRRATAYPGPGIIPALNRTWNVTLSTKF